MSKRILLVDDDPQGLESTQKILLYAGYDVTTAVDGQAALDLVRQASAQGSRWDLVLTDVRMPRMGGLEFLKALSLCGENAPVILMTAFGEVDEAVWAMKMGAVDFLTKPFKRQALLQAVESASKRSRPSGSPSPSASAHQPLAALEPALIGSSPAMQRLRAQIEQVAPTAATVLLWGESGTGKELVSRMLHRLSARASRPFVALNCAAVPENLMESELFGHEKGAFTGATHVKVGLFEAAAGGTLLLDEIGDLPLSLQPKLLRALQESEIRRLGATSSRKVDVRVVAATHRDLRESVRDGKFRSDLLFRLEVVLVHVPALRERMEDLSELAYHFLRQSSAKHHKEISAIQPEVMDRLLAHSWPGNIRELQNVIERAVIFAQQEEIQVSDLPSHLSQGASDSRPAPGQMISVKVGTPLKEVEDLLIRKTLEATDGDKNMTAKLLGINSRTIYRKLDSTKRSEE